MSSKKSRSRRSWLVALVLAWLVFALSFLAVAPLMERFSPHDTGALFVYFCFGAIGAATVLLVVYGVLGPGRLALRTGATLALAAAFYLLWALGYVGSIFAGYRYRYSEPRFADELSAALFSLPIIYVALAAPLWMIRVLFGWRIVADRSPEVPVRESLSIRDVMVVTGAVAVALSLMRLAGQILSVPFTDFLIGMAIAALCCAGISLAGPLPFVVAMLRPRQVTLGFICVGIYLAMATPFIFLIMWMTGNAQFWDATGVYFAILVFVVAQLAVLTVCRQLGYRLVWGRNLAAAHHEDDGTSFSDGGTEPDGSDSAPGTRSPDSDR